MPETTETETTTEPSAGRHEVLVFFDQFATRICACVDAACTEEAFAEADATMGQLEEKYRDYEPTPEEEQEIIELGQRVEGCAARFTTSP